MLHLFTFSVRGTREAPGDPGCGELRRAGTRDPGAPRGRGRAPRAGESLYQSVSNLPVDNSTRILKLVKKTVLTQYGSYCVRPAVQARRVVDYRQPACQWSPHPGWGRRITRCSCRAAPSSCGWHPPCHGEFDPCDARSVPCQPVSRGQCEGKQLHQDGKQHRQHAASTGATPA